MPATARRAADVGHRVMPHDKGQAETQIFTSCMTEENQMLIRKVLVVDDSATDLKKLEQIVAGAGYTVITATSGKEALERVRNDHPDAVLLDIIMNDMNGFQVCRAITADAATKNIPISATSGKEALERVRNDHPDAVLLDIIMNDMNGFQVCRAITADAATKNIP